MTRHPADAPLGRGGITVVVAVVLVLALALAGLLLLDDGARAAVQLGLVVPVVATGLVDRGRRVWVVVVAAAVAHAALTLTLLPVDRAVLDVAVAWVLLALLGLVLVRPARAIVLAGRAGSVSADDEGRTGPGVLVAGLELWPELVAGHGRAAGEAALVHVVDVLRAAVRPGDAVVREGEEIVVLLPRVAAGAVPQRAESLRRTVRDAPLLWKGQELQVTVSVGAAHSADVGEDVDALVAAARAALAEARRQARAGAGEPRASS